MSFSLADFEEVFSNPAESAAVFEMFNTRKQDSITLDDCINM